MSDKNGVSGRDQNIAGSEEMHYVNFIRSNKRGYFKFKRFSQIQTFGDNLMSKKDGVILRRNWKKVLAPKCTCYLQCPRKARTRAVPRQM